MEYQNAVFKPQTSFQLSGGLKALGIVVSLLKLLPIVLVSIAYYAVKNVDPADLNPNDRISLVDLQEELQEAGGIVDVVLISCLIVGGVLLLGQLIASIGNMRLGLLIFSAVLFALDVTFSVLLFLGSSGVLFPALLVLIMGALQLWIIVWTAKSKRMVFDGTSAPIFPSSGGFPPPQ